MSASQLIPALVLLNPAAGGGRALRRWASVEPTVSICLEPEVVVLDFSGSWEAALERALDRGVRTFLAAGGDGTVGTLIDGLVRMRGAVPLGSLTLGAIGLGSSNDFHKPYSNLTATVAVRIGPGRKLRDVCRARFLTAEGIRQERHFIVSASVGLVAQANAFFSGGDRIQQWLRARWTRGAILYATHRTLAGYRNLEAVLRMGDGDGIPCALTNLSVGKTSWVSGGFRYDTPAASDDGLLALNLCQGMTRPATMRALADLARGRFRGRPGRRHWQVPRLDVEMRRPAALELDGEVFEARQVSFEILPEQIGVWS